MLNKIFQTATLKPKAKKTLRDLDRDKHFEALYMQSFTDMRARCSKS